MRERTELFFAQASEDLFVDAAEAAVRHNGDDVAGLKLGYEVSDDLISVGKRECGFALLRNRVN